MVTAAAKQDRGLSLIELVIALAIVAILAGIAYPSYQQHNVRSHRSAAQQFMLNVANREEEYFLSNRQYGILTDLTVTVPEGIGKLYTITATADNTAQPPSYTITAAPKSGTSQASDCILELKSGKMTPECK